MTDEPMDTAAPRTESASRVATEVPLWEGMGQTHTYAHYLTMLDERVIRKAAALAGPPDEALDIGCEGGRWSVLLASLGWRMTCLDVNPKFLAICQARLPEARCILVNPESHEYPVDSDSLGLVAMVEVQALLHEQWVIREVARVLKPGGTFITTIGNRVSWRYLFHTYVPGYNAPHRRSATEVIHPESYAQWRRMLRSCGLRVDYEEGYGWPPFAKKSNSPLVPYAAKVEHALQLRRLPTISPAIIVIARKEA